MADESHQIALPGEVEPQWDSEADDEEPRFPEPYLGLYRQLVADALADTSILPGMGTLAGMLIRKVARDYVAGLMADRQDAFDVAVRCPSCQTVHFQPWWPHRDQRMMRAFSQLLTQARAADLEHAVRTEFVIGLVGEVIRVLDMRVDDPELRVRLKEELRDTFTSYLNADQERRRISSKT